MLQDDWTAEVEDICKQWNVQIQEIQLQKFQVKPGFFQPSIQQKASGWSSLAD